MHAKEGAVLCACEGWSSSRCMRRREQFYVHATDGAVLGACEGGSGSRCMRRREQF